MKLIAAIIAPVSLLGGFAQAGDMVLRLDGASEAKFVASRAALLASLSAEDRFIYAIAEMIVVISLPCGSVKEPISNPELNEVLGPVQVSPKACRQELDGKSSSDIIATAREINRGDPTSLQVPLSNKSLERTLER